MSCVQALNLAYGLYFLEQSLTILLRVFGAKKKRRNRRTCVGSKVGP
jgi:hypothetical protein